MKTLSTTYNISLTKNEIALITTALHAEFEKQRDLWEKDEETYGKYYDWMNDARDLRNAFAGLINRSYMGKDA